MSPGAATARPVEHRGVRRAALVAGVVLAVVATVPVPARLLGGAELAATVRFALLALAVPALLVVGAPWTWLPAVAVSAARRARGRWSGPTWLAADVAVLVAWRTPLLVDAVARHGALAVAEAAMLLVVGTALWLELVESPPLSPRSSQPRRAVLAALAMWSVWIVAYLEGMSHSAWYAGFHHVAGSGLSATADRQASAAVLWAMAAAVYLPVIFWNLAGWLRAESTGVGSRDAHAELGRRRGGAATAPGASDPRTRPAS